MQHYFSRQCVSVDASLPTKSIADFKCVCVHALGPNLFPAGVFHSMTVQLGDEIRDSLVLRACHVTTVPDKAKFGTL